MIAIDVCINECFDLKLYNERLCYQHSSVYDSHTHTPTHIIYIVRASKRLDGKKNSEQCVLMKKSPDLSRKIRIKLGWALKFETLFHRHRIYTLSIYIFRIKSLWKRANEIDNMSSYTHSVCICEHVYNIFLLPWFTYVSSLIFVL